MIAKRFSTWLFGAAVCVFLFTSTWHLPLIDFQSTCVFDEVSAATVDDVNNMPQSLFLICAAGLSSWHVHLFLSPVTLCSQPSAEASSAPLLTRLPLPLKIWWRRWKQQRTWIQTQDKLLKRMTKISWKRKPPKYSVIKGRRRRSMVRAWLSFSLIEG